MPTYVLTNTKTNKSFDKFCSYSDLEKYLEENPHIKKEITAPNIVSDAVTNSPSGKGMDGGMKEVFSKIADKHPSSALADRFGNNRTHKEIKGLVKYILISSFGKYLIKKQGNKIIK